MKRALSSIISSDRANITFLMLIAGLLYSSWPLGYWLNPNAAKGLASDLEALHQPFNWLFIALDILTGLFVAIACFKLSRIVRANSHPKTRLGLWVGVVGVASFGIIVTLFIFFNCFALNQYFQYRQVGKWKDYLYGERVYITLSFVAKSALAWQIFAGALAQSH